MRWPTQLGVAMLLAWASFAAADDPVVWKPVVPAILKMDGKPAKLWQVYRAEKRKNLILVQLGSRFLMLDIEAKETSELDPQVLQRREKDLLWTPVASPAGQPQKAPAATDRTAPGKTVLRSADWVMRSAGRTWLLRVRLVDEGRMLELQLPQLPDLRPLY